MLNYYYFFGFVWLGKEDYERVIQMKPIEIPKPTLNLTHCMKQKTFLAEFKTQPRKWMFKYLYSFGIVFFSR